MASLDPVQEKVAWTARQFKVLRADIRRYLRNKPARIVGEREPNANRLISGIEPYVPIPLSIPFRIGDCLQNVRSSLDYLVRGLVLAANNVPTEEHQFPICSSHGAFKGELRRHRLDGVPPDAVTEIERLQPYHKTKGGLLKLINDFANINKHRRMLLTLLNVVAAETEFTCAHGREVQAIVPTRNHATQVGIGPPMHVAKKVPVRSEAVLALVFDEGAVKGLEVSKCLGLLINEVGNEIIPKFERFFV